MSLGVVDGQLNGGDLLSLLIRDLDAKFVFEGHHQFNGVQGISAQIGNKGLLGGDLRLGHTELFCNDFLDACFDIAHDSSRSWCK